MQSPGKEKIVMVIEDDHDIRETFRQLLEMEGYKVSVACNGQEGLDLLRKGIRPAVILLDLMMPVLNGWEFLAIQKEDPELVSIPVVIVTASGGEKDGALASADRYIKKPIELQVLLDTVKLYCR